jgi:RHS repeat-associated protein
VKTSNAAGVTTLVRRYDVWGSFEVGESEPGFSLTGRDWDPEIALYYYRARYYDPKTGRFTAEDPGRAIDPAQRGGWTTRTSTPGTVRPPSVTPMAASGTSLGLG